MSNELHVVLLSMAEYAALLEPVLPQSAAYARSILRNRAQAEDAVQQAALRGAENLATYDRTRSFKAWWFTILRHCCIDAMRLRKFAPLPADVADKSPDQQDRRENWEELAIALEKIPDEHAAILRLRYFGNLSYHDLAQSLDIPDGTVMSRLHYARKALAQEMKKIRL
jgi:RNA polymerase sigma-70 factor (ECF subfamily)